MKKDSINKKGLPNWRFVEEEQQKVMMSGDEEKAY
jgi:hypothetical protein